MAVGLKIIHVQAIIKYLQKALLKLEDLNI